MPVTPFHFGVGVLLKGAAPGRSSLLAFVVSQVVIDLETAFFLFRREWPVHRALHSFALAIPVGLATGLLVWTAGRLTVRPALRGSAEWGLLPALVGGGLGGATHPLLDAVMHDDIQPLRPFSTANPLHLAVGVATLHVLCLAAGVLGAMLWWMRARARQPPV